MVSAPLGLCGAPRCGAPPSSHATLRAVCAAYAPRATQRTAWYVRCALPRTRSLRAALCMHDTRTQHRLVCAVRPATCAAMRTVCVPRCACMPHAALLGMNVRCAVCTRTTRRTVWYVRCAPPRAPPCAQSACRAVHARHTHARSTVWYVRCAPPHAPPCAQSACLAVHAKHMPHRLVCAVRPATCATRRAVWYVRCAPPRCAVWCVPCAPHGAPFGACRARHMPHRLVCAVRRVHAHHTTHRLVCAVRPCIACRHTRTV